MRYGLAAEFTGLGTGIEGPVRDWIRGKAREFGANVEVETVSVTQGEAEVRQAPRHLASTGEALAWQDDAAPAQPPVRMRAVVNVNQQIAPDYARRFADQARQALSDQGARDVKVSVYQL